MFSPVEKSNIGKTTRKVQRVARDERAAGFACISNCPRNCSGTKWWSEVLARGFLGNTGIEQVRLADSRELLTLAGEHPSRLPYAHT